MNDDTPRRPLRSVGAVLAGFLTIGILSTAIDAVLHATGVYPPAPQIMSHGLFALALSYRIALGVLSGYVTARLAPHRPVAHALALGLVGVVLSTAGSIAMWAYGPAWYSLGNIAIAVPCAWAGARLCLRQLGHRAAVRLAS